MSGIKPKMQKKGRACLMNPFFTEVTYPFVYTRKDPRMTSPSSESGVSMEKIEQVQNTALHSTRIKGFSPTPKSHTFLWFRLLEKRPPSQVNGQETNVDFALSSLRVGYRSLKTFALFPIGTKQHLIIHSQSQKTGKPPP